MLHDYRTMSIGRATDLAARAGVILTALPARLADPFVASRTPLTWCSEPRSDIAELAERQRDALGRGQHLGSEHGRLQVRQGDDTEAALEPLRP
jgi:hypothetical protein